MHGGVAGVAHRVAEGDVTVEDVLEREALQAAHGGRLGLEELPEVHEVEVQAQHQHAGLEDGVAGDHLEGRLEDQLLWVEAAALVLGARVLRGGQRRAQESQRDLVPAELLLHAGEPVEGLDGGQLPVPVPVGQLEEGVQVRDLHAHVRQLLAGLWVGEGQSQLSRRQLGVLVVIGLREDVLQQRPHLIDPRAAHTPMHHLVVQPERRCRVPQPRDDPLVQADQRRPEGLLEAHREPPHGLRAAPGPAVDHPGERHHELRKAQLQVGPADGLLLAHVGADREGLEGKPLGEPAVEESALVQERHPLLRAQGLRIVLPLLLRPLGVDRALAELDRGLVPRQRVGEELEDRLELVLDALEEVVDVLREEHAPEQLQVGPERLPQGRQVHLDDAARGFRNRLVREGAVLAQPRDGLQELPPHDAVRAQHGANLLDRVRGRLAGDEQQIECVPGHRRMRLEDAGLVQHPSERPQSDALGQLVLSAVVRRLHVQEPKLLAVLRDPPADLGEFIGGPPLVQLQARDIPVRLDPSHAC
mmetsp:Transcript_44866/g.118910  ORF Transcript_44866/g.118910 Transcript_44866/m.118910 type:complete len:531 (-) Transcript_44866:769-2361(-)